MRGISWLGEDLVASHKKTLLHGVSYTYNELVQSNSSCGPLEGNVTDGTHTQLATDGEPAEPRAASSRMFKCRAS